MNPELCPTPDAHCPMEKTIADLRDTMLELRDANRDTAALLRSMSERLSEHHQELFAPNTGLHDRALRQESEVKAIGESWRNLVADARRVGVLLIVAIGLAVLAVVGARL